MDGLLQSDSAPAPARSAKRVELVAAECLQPENVFTHTRPSRRASVQESAPRSSGRGSLFSVATARLSENVGRLHGWRLAACLASITVVALLAGLLGGLLPRHSGHASSLRQPDFVTTLVLRRQLRDGLNGTHKYIIIINGTSPGPLLRVREGDLVSITLLNELDDSTALHFHGMRQHNTPWYDGVPGVTQCPVGNATGSNTLVYTFVAEPAGTFFMHAHFRQQLVDGMYAPFIVQRRLEPYSAPADYTEEWTWMAGDWHNAQSLPLAVAYLSAANPDGLEPLPDGFVCNGAFSGAFTQLAQRNATVLLRLINTAGLSHFNFSVDGMPLTVVELDNDPVQPYDVAYVPVDVAQRVAVLLDFRRLDPALASAAALWFRLGLMPASRVLYTDRGLEAPSFRGVISFAGAGAAPTYASPPAPHVAPPSDANLLAARPLASLALAVPPPATHFLNVTMMFATVNNTLMQPVNRAFLNGHTTLPPRAPLLRSPLLFSFLVPANEPFPFPVNDAKSHILQAATAQPGLLPTNTEGHVVLPHGAIVEILVINVDEDSHPFHIHGHAFWVIATSEHPGAETAYASAADGGALRRDSVTVPAAAPNGGPPGWAKLRLRADNPGIWFTHCHIEWHIASGLSMLLIEAPDVLQQRVYSGDLVLPKVQIDNCLSFALTLEAALQANWGTTNSAVDPGRR